MSTGDDAAAAGMPLVPGSRPANELDTVANETRDFIAQGPANWKPGVKLPASKISDGAVPIANGGTGATTAPAARTALGITAANVPTSGGTSNVQADQDYIVGQLGTKLPTAGGVISGALGIAGTLEVVGNTTERGHLFVPNAFAASSGYTIAYINSDGRLSKGASSARFKDDITAIDPASLGDLFPQLSSFIMKDDPGRMTRYGYIAEQLDASDDLRPFVVYEREPVYEQLEVLDDDGDVIGYQQGAVIGSVRTRDEAGNPIPESIDFIALLLAQVAQLHERDAQRALELEQLHDLVTTLGEKVAALEAER